MTAHQEFQTATVTNERRTFMLQGVRTELGHLAPDNAILQLFAAA